MGPPSVDMHKHKVNILEDIVTGQIRGKLENELHTKYVDVREVVMRWARKKALRELDKPRHGDLPWTWMLEVLSG